MYICGTLYSLFLYLSKHKSGIQLICLHLQVEQENLQNFLVMETGKLLEGTKGFDSF